MLLAGRLEESPSPSQVLLLQGQKAPRPAVAPAAPPASHRDSAQSLGFPCAVLGAVKPGSACPINSVAPASGKRSRGGARPASRPLAHRLPKLQVAPRLLRRSSACRPPHTRQGSRGKEQPKPWASQRLCPAWCGDDLALSPMKLGGHVFGALKISGIGRDSWGDVPFSLPSPHSSSVATSSLSTILWLLLHAAWPCPVMACPSGGTCQP